MTLEFDRRVDECIKERNVRELAIGFLRYEALRKLKPREFNELHKRNLAGEFFDEMVNDLGLIALFCGIVTALYFAKMKIAKLEYPLPRHSFSWPTNSGRSSLTLSRNEEALQRL